MANNHYGAIFVHRLWRPFGRVSPRAIAKCLNKYRRLLNFVMQAPFLSQLQLENAFVCPYVHSLICFFPRLMLKENKFFLY